VREIIEIALYNRKNPMNNILVTGASGFVGSQLCNVLRDRGVSVVGAVRRSNGAGQIEMGTISSTTKWSDALEGRDVVIHLMARVHVMKEVSNCPLTEFRAVNVNATLNLARQAAARGVKRFVFVSSVKVNGEATAEKPFTPFDVPFPRDAYSQSKLEAELALKELGFATGLEVVIVRPPLIYGPNVRANFLRLMQLVKLGVPLPLGAIQNRRSMVALDNLVDLLIVCGEHPAATGNTFMVSDDYDLSVSELVRMIACAMAKRAFLLPLPPGVIAGCAALFGKSEMARRLLGSLQVDIDYTKSMLGWKPVTSTQEAIKHTVANFLANPQETLI
jgi:nucleoside-diphosphate-sugar epimerase